MDVSERFKLLVALIGLLTLGGLLVIIVLLVLWRRFNERQSHLATREKSQTNYNDAWSEAGQRLQDDDDDDEEDEDQEDDDEEDDDQSWRPEEPDDDDR